MMDVYFLWDIKTIVEMWGVTSGNLDGKTPDKPMKVELLSQFKPKAMFFLVSGECPFQKVVVVHEVV